MKKASTTVSTERIQQLVLLIRGQKVMLDNDLATLYAICLH